MAQQQQSGISINPRILIALAIAAFSLFSYFGSRVYIPITEQKQHLDMTPNQ